MITIGVVGATGMLGKAVVKAAQAKNYNVIPVDRSIHYALASKNVDAVINCAGVVPTKVPIRYSYLDMVEANSKLPFILSLNCQRLNIPKLVHVSTDCVFSGNKTGLYVVKDIPDPVDFYGQTKVVGEGIWREHSVVRTSFIGFDHGLLEWLIENKDKNVEGWTQAYWTGSTVYEVARRLIRFAVEDYSPGIHHMATEEPYSKFEILRYLNQGLHLRVKIEPILSKRINRALKPTLIIKPVEEVIEELISEYFGFNTSRAEATSSTMA